MSHAGFSFIEAPIYQGQKHFGVALGPAFIRQCLLDQNFNFETYSVTQKQSRKNIGFGAYEELARLTEQELRKNKFPFIAGGDHSLAIGSIQGILRVEPDIKVIWVDAHGDINTRRTSLTGSYHGMPAAFLLGEDQMPGQEWFTAKLKPENLIYFGVRDLDKAEKEYLDQNKIRYYTSSDIKNGNAARIIREISENTAGRKVHFSVDSDAFDPVVAPSTGVPVSDGLSYNIVRDLVLQVQKASDIISYEYVELNPQIFKHHADVFRTAQIGLDLLNEILLNNKQKELSHGRDDEHGYSAGPHLLHPPLQMEKQSRP